MPNIPSRPAPRTPPHPGKTTADNAAEASKKNAAAEEAKKHEGATLNEIKKNPAVLRSRYNLRDPDSGTFINAGELTEIAHVSAWVRSQINAGIIEVVSGDDDAPDEPQNSRPLPGSHAEAVANGTAAAVAGTPENGVVELTKLDGESDEDFENRKKEAAEKAESGEA